MNSPSPPRPIPDRLAAVLPAPFSLPCRRMLRGLLLPLLLGLGFATPAAKLFVKVENPGWTPIRQWECLPVWADYDGDGWIDLHLNTSSWEIQTRVANRLYRNNRDGTFTLKLADKVGPLAASSRQWHSESGALEGQTGAVLTLTNLQPSQAGRCTVVAQTDTGSQTHHVYLRVLSPTLAATRVAEGLRLECRGEGDTSYTFQSSASLTGPWADHKTVTTDSAGIATATVPVEEGARFFRVPKE